MKIGAGLEVKRDVEFIYPAIIKNGHILGRIDTHFGRFIGFSAEELFAIARHMKKMEAKSK
jgi:hypothetical protein